MRRVLEEFVDRSPGRLLVRSDGADEALHPGSGRTVVAAANPDAVTSALERVANGNRAAAVVQAAIEPAVVGLLSNERRVAEHPHDWVLEGEIHLRGPEIRRIRASEVEGFALDASSPSSAVESVRRIARYLQGIGGRWRVEWLWDGERIWVVQADSVREGAAADRPLGKLPSVEVPRGRLLGSVRFPGRKLDRWRTFEQLDLPRIELLAIDGRRYQTSRQQELIEAIEELGPGPLVVRTDLAAAHDPLLLPTSGPMSRPTDVLSYMRETSERFAKAGVPSDGWAFLVAVLVPAQASAWAQIDAAGEVTITALWGYPDGLLHLPHDSYTIDTTSEVEVLRSFKPACLVPRAGKWVTQSVPPPFDWQRVLDDEEARAIAQLARKVADKAGPMQLLVLAQVGGLRGRDGLLPFHFTRLTSTPGPVRSALAAERDEVVLRRPQDLDAIASDPAPAAVRVEPSPAWLRDAGFLTDIGAWAASRGVVILFAGSILGHAFHLLSNAGATVVTPRDSRIDHGEPLCTVVVAHYGGLERVRTLPCQDARQLAVETLAALAINASLDADDEEHVRRALWVLHPALHVDRPPEAGFESLGWLRAGQESLNGPGTVPLFMDTAGSAPVAQLARSGITVPATGRDKSNAGLRSTFPLADGWELRISVGEHQIDVMVRPAGGVD